MMMDHGGGGERRVEGKTLRDFYEIRLLNERGKRKGKDISCVIIRQT